jgi:PIN domain nuclease of toxin-antitoxin system
VALLLDTCAMVFFGENTGDLSEEAMLAIETRIEAIFVSAVSIAELACAQDRGRLKRFRNTRAAAGVCGARIPACG